MVRVQYRGIVGTVGTVLHCTVLDSTGLDCMVIVQYRGIVGTVGTVLYCTDCTGQYRSGLYGKSTVQGYRRDSRYSTVLH
jgi:hypothetical protein